jgi:hypothetical protein
MERDLQQKCIKYCRSEGLYYINTHGDGYGGKGTPDLLICVNGRFVAVELKVESGVIAPSQQIHRKRIERSSGTHFYCYSIEDFVEKIGALQNDKI